MKHGLFSRLRRYAECCGAHVWNIYTALLAFAKPCTRKKILMFGLLSSGLMLSSCGYHLVGHGDGSGAIPADVRTVSIAVHGDQQKVSSMLRQALASESFALTESTDIDDTKSHAVLRVNVAPVLFVPSAYDVAGVATQYRMTYSGSLLVQRDGEQLWKSGLLQRSGTVYVAGGPASIEASRERLMRDLRKEWVSDALGRLRSGF